MICLLTAFILMAYYLIVIIMSLRIVSYNCNGLNLYSKRASLFNYLKNTSFDICCLQETHAENSFSTDDWNKLWGENSIWAYGTKHSRGVGIIFNRNLNVDVTSKFVDIEGRLIAVDVKINNIGFRLLNVYAPNKPSERKLFFQNMQQFLLFNSSMILCGDFNCVENAVLDKCGGNAALGELASGDLFTISHDYNLIDSFRILHPNIKLYSWCSPSKDIYCRLDRIYVSNTLVDVLLDASIDLTIALSDHSPVSIIIRCSDVALNATVAGPSLWKCNSSVVKDEYFRDDFVRLWYSLDSNAIKSSAWWDNCKCHFRSLIIAHSQRLALAKKIDIKSLQAEIADLQSNNTISFDVKRNTLSELQTQLELLLSSKLEGAKIRSKAVYLDTHEKLSSYFLRTEKRNAVRKEMSSVLTDRGEVTSQADIVDACVHFYSKLYSSEPISEGHKSFFLDDPSLPRLVASDANMLDGPITKDECVLALKAMANNKSPGLDGLTKEFYDILFPIIGDSFVCMINNSFSNGLLSDSQRTGLITLICKDTDHRSDLSYWRPISLLNYDYKIISKVIFLRLRNVMDSIVNIDQTCSIFGRSILDNLHLMRNVIDYVNSKNIKAAILSLDQSKAFDRVSHDYLFSVLDKLGFGENFISWIRLLYTDARSSIYVNGQVSVPFNISRSVRQGCSLSPLLYVLCMEPFAHKIRRDLFIKGLQLPGTADQVRISQYADDTNIVVCTMRSIDRVFFLVESYCLASASKLNKNKTWGIWLGGWRNCADTPCNNNWTNSYRKLCGVILGNGNFININWKDRRQKMSTAINIHSARALSIRGKCSCR